MKAIDFQKFIVVAGSFRQYEDWKRANQISFNDLNYRYCYDLSSIRRFHSDEYAVKLIGTWYERKDLNHLKEYFTFNNFLYA